MSRPPLCMVRLEERLYYMFFENHSIKRRLNISNPLKITPLQRGDPDVVDFRIERLYVEICRSCFLHFARKRSYVEICWSCFLHSARMIYEKRAIFAIFRDFLRGKPLGQLHHGHVRYRA